MEALGFLSKDHRLHSLTYSISLQRGKPKARDLEEFERIITPAANKDRPDLKGIHEMMNGLKKTTIEGIVKMSYAQDTIDRLVDRTVFSCLSRFS